jgi:hypothetical protein
MRLNLLPILVAAGVLIAPEPYEAVAAPVTAAAARITPTVVGGSIEKIYYYHGHYYPYYIAAVTIPIAMGDSIIGTVTIVLTAGTTTDGRSGPAW